MSRTANNANNMG